MSRSDLTIGRMGHLVRRVLATAGAPGRIRTCDTGFRRAVLYPLSYEGGIEWELTA